MKLAEILEADQDDETTISRLVEECGFSPAFAAELVGASRHEGEVDNVRIVVGSDRAAP